MTSSMHGQATTGVNGAPAQGGQLQEAATGLLGQAARTADAQASTRMTMAGEALDGVAQAIDDAAARLRETQPEIAGFVTTAGEKVQGAATYLRDHDASEALESLQDLARRQPAVVVGGGLLLGLALGRFLRSGASGMHPAYGGGSAAYGSRGYRYGDTGYGTSEYGATGRYGTSDRYGTAGISGATAVGGGTAYGSRAGYDPTTGASLEGRSDIGDIGDELAATDVAAVDDVEPTDELGQATTSSRTTGEGA